jgi:glucokinase
VTYGIDIGGTKVLGVALGSGEGIVAEARVPTPTGTREIVGSHVADAVAEVAAELDRSLGLDASSGPAPVGVGAPGMVDRRGRLCFAPNLPQAHGVDWTELIGARLPGRFVLIENDANFAVLAEHRLGAARAYRHVVMVTLGTGIGGGIVIDGRVEVGSAGFAGEIGHMVVDPAGPPCPCGRRGCWERYASGAGLGLAAREAALAGRLDGVVRLAGGDPENVRGEDVSAAAAAGDPAARRVIEEVGRWVGFGLANLAAVLDPECFVLGGGLVRAGDLLLDAARAAFRELVEGGDRRPLAAVVPAALGERAGAVGAALGARQRGLW